MNESSPQRPSNIKRERELPDVIVQHRRHPALRPDPFDNKAGTQSNENGAFLLDAAQDLWCRACTGNDLLEVEDLLRRALRALETAVSGATAAELGEGNPHLYAAVQRLGVLLLQSPKASRGCVWPRCRAA